MVFVYWMHGSVCWWIVIRYRRIFVILNRIFDEFYMEFRGTYVNDRVQHRRGYSTYNLRPVMFNNKFSVNVAHLSHQIELLIHHHHHFLIFTKKSSIWFKNHNFIKNHSRTCQTINFIITYIFIVINHVEFTISFLFEFAYLI